MFSPGRRGGSCLKRWIRGDMLVVLAVVCIVFLIVTRQKKGVAKEDIY